MPFNPSSQFQKGFFLIQQGRYKEAAEFYQQTLSRDPHDPYALHMLALCQYHLNDNKSSLTTINAALAIEPENPTHLEMKALILSADGKNKAALNAIRDALTLDPDSASAYAVEAYIFIKTSEWAMAEAAARNALECDPENVMAGNLLATALQMQNKLDENQHLVSDLLAKDPEDAHSHSNAGWVHFHKSNYKQAQVHFKEALRLDANFEPARIGMLETVKIKSYIYRLYTKYSFFMSRQKKSVQLGLIIGIYIAYRLLRDLLANQHSQTFTMLATLLGVVYFMFAFWSWVADGIGHFIAMTDPFGRLALKRNEKLDAIFVGGGVFVGLVLLLLALILQSIHPFFLLGATILAAVFPFSCTFKNPNRTGRLFYGISGALLLFLGAVAVITYDSPISDGCFGLGLGILILITWLGAFGLMKQEN